MSRLTVGALFAGYGGLDLAVADAFGADLAWYAEIDGLPTARRPESTGACAVMEHRFPGVRNLGDVTTIDWDTVPTVSILTGGSPCQDLSSAGARAGMTEGTRSNLWVAMREAIARKEPDLVVWENVRGAYSAGAHSNLEPCPGCLGDRSGHALRALGRVLGDLDGLGYDVRWHGLRAADVGAPHGRYRIFALGIKRGAELPDLQPSRFRLIDADDDRLLPTPMTDAGSPTHAAGNPTLSGAILGIDERTAARFGKSATPGLLPTPTAATFDGNADDYQSRTAANPVIGGPSLGVALDALLPTPRATAMDNSPGEGFTPSVGHVVRHLLPTPKATNNENKPSPAYRGGLGWVINEELEPGLLPTPSPFHMGNQETPDEWLERRAEVEARTGTRHGPALSVVAHSVADGAPLIQDGHGPHLLPTPLTQDTGTTRENNIFRDLRHIGALDAWGPYATAIARWAALLGRPAPEPTAISRAWHEQRTKRFADRSAPVGMRGSLRPFLRPRRRLNPRFVEWMMGLPDGWVTDVPGVSHSQALHALGNGVVPQQAAAALRILAALPADLVPAQPSPHAEGGAA